MEKLSTATINALPMEHSRVLWVDDKPHEILRLKRMLNDHGMDIHVEDSYRRAQAAVRKQQFDLMLFDLLLGRSNGITLSNYTRTLIKKKYGRSVHFIAVTNFKDKFAEELRKEGFTFVYEKDQLNNGMSKTFVEDCLFSVADSRMMADYPELMEKPVIQSVEPESVEHVRCDVGYVLRLERPEVLVRLWRRGAPGERTIRVFDRSFLRERRVREQGQPFRIDTFEGKEDKALVTLIRPLHEKTDRSRRRIAPEIDLKRFRKGTGE